MSQTNSRISCTNSQVSQVDFKFKSNDIKKKLRLLLKNLDTDKQGMVKHEVFFELLNLHRIQLSLDAKNYLKRNYSKNQTINYKEALNQITIDLDAAGGTEDEEGMMKWTVFALQKKQSQIGDDSVSQVGSSYRYKQPLKSIGGLSSDKLANFDRISQPRDTLSRIPS